jgi:hypothetical protein
MTPQTLLADQIERIADSMAHFIKATKEEALGWRPEIPGSAGSRSVLEMAGECVAVNLRFGAKLVGDEGQPVSEPEFTSAEEATRAILSSAQALAQTVRGLSDEALGAEHLHKGKQISGTNLIVGAYRNMAYHSGQVNLIQMLKGDAEFHRPQSW